MEYLSLVRLTQYVLFFKIEYLKRRILFKRDLIVRLLNSPNVSWVLINFLLMKQYRINLFQNFDKIKIILLNNQIISQVFSFFHHKLDLFCLKVLNGTLQVYCFKLVYSFYGIYIFYHIQHSYILLCIIILRISNSFFFSLYSFNTSFTETIFSWLIPHLIKSKKSKTYMVFNLVCANKASFWCFFSFLKTVYVRCLTTEISTHILILLQNMQYLGIPINKAKADIKTHSVIAEM